MCLQIQTRKLRGRSIQARISDCWTRHGNYSTIFDENASKGRLAVSQRKPGNLCTLNGLPHEEWSALKNGHWKDFRSKYILCATSSMPFAVCKRRARTSRLEGTIYLALVDKDDLKNCSWIEDGVRMFWWGRWNATLKAHDVYIRVEVEPKFATLQTRTEQTTLPFNYWWGDVQSKSLGAVKVQSSNMDNLLIYRQ